MTILEKILGKKQTSFDMEFQSTKAVAEHCDWRITKCLEAVRREKRKFYAKAGKKEPYLFSDVQSAFQNIELELRRLRRLDH